MIALVRGVIFSRIFAASMLRVPGSMSTSTGFAPRDVTPEATRADWNLPYDDVRRVLEETAAVTIIDCVCRLERATLGEPCEYPTHICMTLHDEVPESDEGLVSKDEALRLLAEADRLGLVHVATNVAGGWEFICHCCGCCCQFLRALTEWDAGSSVVSKLCRAQLGILRHLGLQRKHLDLPV